MDESDSGSLQSSKRRRTSGRNSEVWNHFERVSETHAKCNLCKGKPVVLQFDKATSPLLSHLRRCHNKLPADTCSGSLDRFLVRTASLVDKECSVGLLRVIVADMRPLSLGDTSSFRDFARMAAVTLPGRNKITKYPQ